MSYSPTESLDRLYRLHHGWLLQWIGRRTRDRECAAELAQDTFLRLLSKPADLSQLRQQRAYLSTIAHALMVSHWRRADLERSYLQALAAQEPTAQPSPEQRLAALQLLHAVAEKLEGLAPRPRQAFLLARLSGLGYAEIGCRLGVSERMVKKYMAQAMLHCLRLHTPELISA